jgi:Zn-dependent protease with chaperone function
VIHILIIAAFVILFLRDELRGMSPTFYRELGPAGAAFTSIAAMLCVWLCTQAAILQQVRRMDRGRNRAVLWTDRIMLLSRLAALAVHALNILVFGWLDAVRAAVGRVILLDELLGIAPLILVLIGGWWTIYPVERRIRDALLLRDLDLGRPVRPMPGRWAFVLTTLRHQAALVLVPILVILALREVIDAGERRGWFPEWLPVLGIQLAGAVLALTLMPLVLRRIWDTINLEAGPLRDDLVSMCRDHGIRVRDVLLWRTNGTMINGAVLGLIGPARYVLLTDALLESLPGDQVRAVMAHELGHIRRRHMPWLAAGALCSIILASAAVEIALHWLAPMWVYTNAGQAAIIVAGMGTGLLVFGFASRRFEWQADAFAVQHLSGWRGRPDPTLTIAPMAVAAMNGALSTVAALNHIPLHRFTWRHGSIASRQRKLLSLVGRPAARTRPDFEAGIVKLLILAAMVLVAGLLALESMA